MKAIDLVIGCIVSAGPVKYRSTFLKVLVYYILNILVPEVFQFYVLK